MGRPAQQARREKLGCRAAESRDQPVSTTAGVDNATFDIETFENKATVDSQALDRATFGTGEERRFAEKNASFAVGRGIGPGAMCRLVGMAFDEWGHGGPAKRRRVVDIVHPQIKCGGVHGVYGLRCMWRGAGGEPSRTHARQRRLRGCLLHRECKSRIAAPGSTVDDVKARLVTRGGFVKD